MLRAPSLTQVPVMRKGVLLEGYQKAVISLRGIEIDVFRGDDGKRCQQMGISLDLSMKLSLFGESQTIAILMMGVYKVQGGSDRWACNEHSLLLGAKKEELNAERREYFKVILKCEGEERCMVIR